MQLPRPLSVASISILLFPLASCQQVYAAHALQALSQLGRVEVSESIGGSGPTLATSMELESLNLVAGNTGLEATLRTDFLPVEAPWTGVEGTLFVQANSVDVASSTAMARYEYDFLLSHDAEIGFLRFTTGVNQSLAISFLLEKDGVPVFSSSGDPLLVYDGRLLSGTYSLAVEASAIASNLVAEEFVATQVDFALLIVEVPEPSTLSIVVVFIGFYVLTISRGRLSRF